MGRVDGKVAIVTGGAMGLGEADCELLAKEGAQVIVADFDVEKGQAVADRIENGVFFKLDVTSEENWKEIIDFTKDKYGRLDVLVNNAGIVLIGDPISATLDDFRKVNAVSNEGTFLGCKYAIPLMRDTGGGSIINMSSIAALGGQIPFATYCAAKGAVRSYSKAVAVFCAQNEMKIRCNSIHPGGIVTPMTQALPEVMGARMSELTLPTFNANPPQGAIGEPDDIANAVLYLASDEARWVNGSELVIDNSSTVTAGPVPY